MLAELNTQINAENFYTHRITDNGITTEVTGYYLPGPEFMRESILSMYTIKRESGEVSAMGIFVKDREVSLLELGTRNSFELYSPTGTGKEPETYIHTHLKIDGIPGDVFLALKLDTTGNIGITPHVELPLSKIRNYDLVNDYDETHWQINTNRGSVIIPKTTTIVEIQKRIEGLASEHNPWENNCNTYNVLDDTTGTYTEVQMQTFSLLGIVPEE